MAPWPEVPGNKEHTNAAVVIIGAGISGICTAIDLVKRNNCRNFVILEKGTGVGGTWNDQRYPGCCCDVWSMLYSFSFAQNAAWTREYPGQEEILRYLVRVAEEYNLYQHVRFNSEVQEARWNETDKKWHTSVKIAGGSKDAEIHDAYTIKSDFLVSAVGQLNQPKYPDIKGIDSFKGKKMHSARWDWSYDLTDKRIAVLGNGCTAAQILPEIAKVAKHVTIFQRTPNWIIPRDDTAVSPFWQGVYKYVPPIRWRKRAGQMDFRESFHDAVWDGNSALAQALRDFHQMKLETELPNHKHLWEKLTPKYNPGAKRVIITDDYFPTLALPHVDLETRPVDSIGETTIKVKDDAGNAVDLEPEFDLLVCATGFKTVDFMHPIDMYGKNGASLRDIWKDGAQAYYGTTVQDMPNFAMLYGPNTNLGHNSIILMIEQQSRYINGLIKPVLDAKKQGKNLTITPKIENVKAYNTMIQEELNQSSFADPNCTSWYRNEAGLITNNWSRTVVAYQKMLETVNFTDYEVEGSGAELVKNQPKLKVGRTQEESSVSDRTLLALGILSTAAVVGGFVMRNSKYLSSLRVR